MDPKGKVVLVTGAGRGIGRAVAVAFGFEGAKVALVGRTKKYLTDVQKELKELGVSSAVLPGDVSDEGVVSRVVAAAEQQLGPVDVLVNNAGIYVAAPVERMDTLAFDRVLAVNLRGPFLMSRAVLPGMKSRRRGHIVNVASTAGRRGFAGGGAYCASKFGLVGLSEAMMYEARTSDVRVSVVYPSTVATDLVRKAGMTFDEKKAHPARGRRGGDRGAREDGRPGPREGSRDLADEPVSGPEAQKPRPHTPAQPAAREGNLARPPAAPPRRDALRGLRDRPRRRPRHVRRPHGPVRARGGPLRRRLELERHPRRGRRRARGRRDRDGPRRLPRGQERVRHLALASSGASTRRSTRSRRRRRTRSARSSRAGASRARPRQGDGGRLLGQATGGWSS